MSTRYTLEWRNGKTWERSAHEFASLQEAQDYKQELNPGRCRFLEIREVKIKENVKDFARQAN